MKKRFPALITAQYPIIILATLMDWLGISKELKETRDTVKQAADAMALAVPGERYQRLFDAIHRGTAKEQADAKAFIKSAFKIDLDLNYEVSVNFSFDTTSKTKLHADIFAGGTPYVADVTAYIADSLNPDPPISSNVLIPMTDAEIWKAIDKLIRRNLVGTYTNPSDGRFSLGPPYGAVGVQLIGRSYNPDHSDQLVQDLTEAIMTVRGQRTMPLTAPRSIRYNPLSGQDYVFVLINREDLETVTAGKLEDSFTVQMLAHETGHPDRPLVNSRPFILGKKDFLLPEHPSVTHPTKGTFVWAVRQVTQYQGISESYLQKLKQLRELSQKYGK